MEIIHSLIVLLFSVSPIFSYYMSEDNTKTGYVSVQKSGRKYERRGIRGMQRRHFAGSTDQHKNENIVDAHFKVKKTLPYLPYHLEKSGGEVPIQRWNTDAPPNHQTKHDKEIVEDKGMQESVVHGNQIGRSIDKTQRNQFLNDQRSRPIHVDYLPQIPQRQNVQMRRQDYQNRYDTKPSLQMNVRKTQVATAPQTVRLNNNHQITSISVHRPEDKYQKIPTSLVIDKTLEQVSVHNNDHNKQVMTRVLEDMTHDVTDTKFKGVYRKRHIENNYRYDFNKVNRNLISDTIRKYIVGKDKAINLGRKSTKEFSRIGNHEESIEAEESPYAIFYRMHPNNLDEQEGFASMGSMEENTNMFSNKKKRLSVGYENEVDLKKTKKRPKKNSHAVKIHKKVKNFSNYLTL